MCCPAAAWSSATAYNRGQVIYRLAEMIESRADVLAATCTGRAEVVAGRTAGNNEILLAMEGVTHVVNFAAESMVDRSIDDPAP
mgnify:CR=1 FL=1